MMEDTRTTPYANSVFEQPWWLDIVAPGKWGEAVVKDGEEVVARLPYVFDRGRISSPRYTQTLGIWMNEKDRRPLRGNEQFSRQKEIIRQLLDQLPVKNRIDLILDSSQSYVLPFRWEGYTIEPTFSYRIPLGSDLNTIESNYSKSIKRDVNRGSKSLIVEDSSEIEDFVELQNMTYKRQNRRNPVDNSFTFHVIERSMKLDHGKLLIARDSDGKAHAGSFILYDEKVCYHLMSGQDTSYGNDCAMPLLFQKEVAIAKEKSKAFDFEGSMIEGIEQTYRRYGGNNVINWHVYKQPLLSEVAHILKPRVKRMIRYKM